jgi:hypothetical protein
MIGAREEKTDGWTDRHTEDDKERQWTNRWIEEGMNG